MTKFYSTLFFAFIAVLGQSQCQPGEVEVTMTMHTDPWGYENYWQLNPAGSGCGNNIIAEGANLNVGCAGTEAGNSPGGYDNNSTYYEGPFCLAEGEYFDLIFIDSYGDGGLAIEVFENGILTHVYYGGGTGNTWTFQAGVSNNPIYDQPCGALEVIADGGAIELTNTNAMAGYGEIAPANGGCGIPGLWCENGISNTVWAYFIPEAGVSYEITTCGDIPGFDTQIALWKGNDCSVLNAFEFIASNDDMGGCTTADGFSSLMHAECLEAGAVYYIQIDGWNGAVGTASLEVNTYTGGHSLGAQVNNVACPLNKGEVGSGSIFTWVNGSGSNYSASWTGPDGYTSSNNMIYDLVPGDYSVTVTTTCGDVFTDDFTVSQPEMWNAYLTITDPSCPQSEDGELVANASGATAPYTYFWTGPDGFFGENQTISNAGSGIYNVQISDANNCTYQLEYNLTPADAFEIDLGADIVMCINESEVVSAPLGYSYIWQDGSGNQFFEIVASEWGLGEHALILTATTADGCSDTDVFGFIVEDCNSIDESSMMNWNIYPQPSNGQFVLTADRNLNGCSVSILDAVGKTVYTNNAIQGQMLNIDLNVEAGLYFITLNENNTISTGKLVIE